MRQDYYAGEVKAQTGGANLHAEPRFRLRFSSEWSVSRSRICAAINLTGDAELFVYAEDACRTISQHIILGEQFSWRSQDCDAQVAECIKATIMTKLLADQYRTLRVSLIKTDATRLIRIWQSHTDTETYRRTTSGLAAQFDLGPED